MGAHCSEEAHRQPHKRSGTVRANRGNRGRGQAGPQQSSGWHANLGSPVPGNCLPATRFDDDDDAASTVSVYLDENAQLVLLKLVYEYKLLVFSKTRCPACVRVKNAFDEAGLDYCYINLDEDCPQGERLFDALEEWTGQRTVPRVFCRGRFVGGSVATLAEMAKMKAGEPSRLDMRSSRR